LEIFGYFHQLCGEKFLGGENKMSFESEKQSLLDQATDQGLPK